MASSVRHPRRIALLVVVDTDRCASGHRYWLHHTMASSPRGCLSVSFWMESAPHEALLALLREELPHEPSWEGMPPMEGRLTVGRAK